MARTVQDWLEAYGESHRHPVNKRIHWICVPLIVLSLIGLLWSIPVPEPLQAMAAPFNWASLFLLAAVLYYLLLSPALALGMLLFSILLLVVTWGLDQLPVPLWALALAIFVLAWIGQFIGHRIEGRSPSFFQDLQFLMIGPLWLLAHLYRALGIRYG
ncbi:Mpo1-like protein [Gammaproteobacteria bacterium AB-CW1]|uniref:Mpo1-like protein n=1 Tax=Natronospira elongata TaxID=3110268 RepID=A0AAP6JHL4_9GAMM|nr:Mpo1-like protein [Gammaproteobacteria bacterium AB-CW1]